MAPHSTKKNRAVCRKKPIEVGQPPLSDTMNIHPKTFCDILNVSGLAIKKKISVE